MKKFKFAVIGKDVSQSSSPRMHTFIAKKLGATIYPFPRKNFPRGRAVFLKNTTVSTSLFHSSST